MVNTSDCGSEEWGFESPQSPWKLLAFIFNGGCIMENMEKNQIYNTDRVVHCSDGLYRWIYELNMYRNPIIFYTVVKVLGISFAVVAVFMFIVSLFDSGFSLSSVFDGFGDMLHQSDTKYAFIALLVFLSVVVLSYFIVAKSYGGKYMVLFEMDDKQIVHQQMESQFKKMQAINWLTFMAGAVSGNYSMMGLSINNSVRSSMTSEYAHVRKIIPKKRLNTIKVNELLEHNQIYVCDEDFDFVLNYLREHCKC